MADSAQGVRKGAPGFLQPAPPELRLSLLLHQLPSLRLLDAKDYVLSLAVLACTARLAGNSARHALRLARARAKRQQHEEQKQKKRSASWPGSDARYRVPIDVRARAQERLAPADA